MEVLEYRGQNEITAYPFIDGSPLIDDSLSYTIPENLFIECLIFEPDTTYEVYLSRLQSTGGNILATFSKVTDDSVVLVFSIPKVSATAGTLYIASSGVKSGKLIFGSGITDFLDLPVVIDETFDFSFSSDKTPLINSLSVTGVVDVNEISFDNGLTYKAGPEITIKAGANVQFEQGENKIFVDVVPGAGTGLFDECSLYPDAIKSINGISGENRRFRISSGECYQHIPITNGLHISNTCSPDCTAEDFIKVGYYMNRLSDALHNATYGLVTKANTAGTTIISSTNDYINNIIPLRQKPFMLVNVLASDASSFSLISILVANPSTADITGATITFSPSLSPYTDPIVKTSSGIISSVFPTGGFTLQSKDEEGCWKQIQFQTGVSGVDVAATFTYDIGNGPETDVVIFGT